MLIKAEAEKRRIVKVGAKDLGDLDLSGTIDARTNM